MGLRLLSSRERLGTFSRTKRLIRGMASLRSTVQGAARPGFGLTGELRLSGIGTDRRLSSSLLAITSRTSSVWGARAPASKIGRASSTDLILNERELGPPVTPQYVDAHAGLPQTLRGPAVVLPTPTVCPARVLK